LTKAVTRVSTRPYTGRFKDGRNRKLVCTLLPGDLIAIRPHRTRRIETLPLSDVYEMALWARIRAAKTAKVKAKKK
jgi:hypothetical protein